ncbi:hypothetical protein [Mesorhizobium sp.]|uniref:hypothetical protein n=1 Tax=Mesorhizobium sp. TaxID=1871066 RepID=UPI000FE61836|nr:hypothetical protein [Mesorhizobium sp.]RWA64410.1 MAG: hypothetical protein EOQ27_09705 [Mesorhizobium sp.]
MMNKTAKAPVSVESISDGLAKLIRDVRMLQGEVRSLTDGVRGFTGSAGPRHRWILLPPEAGGGTRAMSQTQEPRSAISMARYEYGSNPDLEIPTKTLLAIAKEIDGALRDIRAARLDLREIAGDDVLREEFKEWQRQQKR